MAQSSNRHVLDGYVNSKRIGVGTTSKVFLAYSKETGEPVAVKVIKRNTLSRNEEENVMSEIQFLKMFDHKHIVKFIDYMVTPKYIFIIQEYCDGGNLFDYIKKHGPLSEKTCQQLLQQLASALKYMRSHNVSHLDIKPDNIFTIQSETIYIKLGDFGLSKLMTENTKNHYFCGSFVYMAPEMMINKGFDIKADLWSIGVVLYECLFLRTLYIIPNIGYMKTLIATVKKQKPIDIPSPISPKCKDLLMALLQYDPSKRMNHKQFYIHPFVDLDHTAYQESLSKVDIRATHLERERADKTLKYKLKTKKESFNEIVHQLKKQLYFEPQEELATVPKNDYQTLKTMCQNIPLFDFALETGVSAKLYASKGEIESATERLKTCLRSLKLLDLELLDTKYNNIIKQQITEWTEEYEVVQTLLLKTKETGRIPIPVHTESTIDSKSTVSVPTEREFTSSKSTGSESHESEFIIGGSTNEQSTSAQPADDQSVDNQVADTSEEHPVAIVRKVNKIKKWFNAHIQLFKRRTN